MRPSNSVTRVAVPPPDHRSHRANSPVEPAANLLSSFLRLVLATALAGSVAGPARAAAAVTLAYKPSPTVLTYGLHTEEHRSLRGGAKHTPMTRSITTQVVTQRVQAKEDGSLLVEFERTRGETRLFHKRRSTATLPPTRGSVSMSPSGRRTPGASGPDPLAGLEPEFPPGPITEGHTWKTRVARSGQLPVDLEVVHKLSSLRLSGQRTIAVVTSRARGSGKDDATGARVEVHYSGGLNLDVEGGIVEQSRAHLDVRVTRDPKGAKGPGSVRNVVTRTVQRVP